MHCRQGKWEGNELGKGLSDCRFHSNSPVTGEALIIAVTNRYTHKKAFNYVMEEKLLQMKSRNDKGELMH